MNVERNAMLAEQKDAEIASLRQRLEEAERERDEAMRCLRRCAVTASNLTSDPDNVSAEDGEKIDAALANPLSADELVNNRICELECEAAQAADFRERWKKKATALEATLAAAREANDELAKTIARMTEDAALKQRVKDTSAKMVEGVWADHQKQFDQQQAKIERLEATLAAIRDDNQQLRTEIERLRGAGDAMYVELDKMFVGTPGQKNPKGTP